jgi:hypothetical protein
MGTPPLKVRLKDALWAVKENRRAKVWMMAAVVVVLLVVLAVALFYINRRSAALDQSNADTVNIDLADTVEPVGPLRRFIDGVTVEPGKENLLPKAVMIENLVTVRPQSGLQAAQVVYETLAEGGITRFLAVYATDELLPEIGPVRSARHYFVDWAEEYEGLYAHAGGSPQALGQLATTNHFVLTLNQVGGDHAYFWRDQGIAAPHNLFTSMELLQFALRDNEALEKSGSFSPWKFGSELPRDQRPAEPKTITIPFSSASYEVRYEYSPEQNVYERFNGGEEHIDAATSQPLTVRNVVVQFAEVSLLDPVSGRLEVITQGEGRAVVFHDGTASEGTWRREPGSGRTRFFDSAGAEVNFIPGNIWIHVLPTDRTLEYN